MSLQKFVRGLFNAAYNFRGAPLTLISRWIEGGLDTKVDTDNVATHVSEDDPAWIQVDAHFIFFSLFSEASFSNIHVLFFSLFS